MPARRRCTPATLTLSSPGQLDASAARIAPTTFDEWLAKTLKDPASRVALGIVEGRVAGISVWKPKDARVAKAKTEADYKVALKGA